MRTKIPKWLIVGFCLLALFMVVTMLNQLTKPAKVSDRQIPDPLQATAQPVVPIKNSPQPVTPQSSDVESSRQPTPATDRMKRVTATYGELVVIKTGNSEAIKLAERVIYDQGDRTILIHDFYTISDSSNVFLMELTSGDASCPAKYRFVSISPDKEIAVSDRFGTCSNNVLVTMGETTIRVDLPSGRDGGDGLWTYFLEGNKLSDWSPKPSVPKPSVAQTVTPGGIEDQACQQAKSRCYGRGSPTMVEMCLNALRSVRGCD